MPETINPAPVRFFRRELDYLQDLGLKLRNLKGFATLAHELLQNADDVPGASTFAFNVCDDALIVENNGKFSDCGSLDDKECPLKDLPEHGSHRCDFHRFCVVAGADKRNEVGTTGAFGIGFISVYQITDRPELISSGHHWIIDESQPPDNRIGECGGCERCHASNPGTRFYLPWASDPNSVLRRGLKTESTAADTPSQFVAELEASLPTSMLFLKKLARVEIRQNGKLIRKLERVKDSDSIILNVGDNTPDIVWFLVRGNFSETADALRSKHPDRIEPKRSSEVVIAIPDSELKSGLLCATLPTQESTGFPFHINADFFPTEDRKRIIVGQDFQAEWNRAALEAAAKALSDSVIQVRDELGPKRFWSFLNRLQQVSVNSGGGINDSIYAKFWSALTPKLASQAIIFNNQKNWCKPSAVFYLMQKEESSSLPVLEAIGLSCVHEDLRPYQNILISKEIGVRQLAIDHLVQQLRKAGLTISFPKDQWPEFLKPSGALKSLWEEVGLLLSRRSLGTQQTHLSGNSVSSVLDLSLAVNRHGALCPCHLVYRSSTAAAEKMFLQLDPAIPFANSATSDFPLFRSLCLAFGPAQAVEVLQKLDSQNFADAVVAAKITSSALVAWFVDYRTEILADSALTKSFVNLPIFPSAGGFHPLSKLSLPGNFSDPLHLAAILDVSVLPSHHDFLRELGIDDLTFPVYVAKHLIPSFSTQDLLPEKRRAVVLLLATRRSEISEVAGIKESLAGLKIVECLDGIFRTPVEVYFSNNIVAEVLGSDVPQASIPEEHAPLITEFLTWLSVTENPRLENIAQHVQAIVAIPPTADSIASIQVIFSHLAGRLQSGDSADGLTGLKQIDWLPSRTDQTRWFKPSELHATFQDYLFESQADFLNIDRKFQTGASALLDFLGVNKSPSVGQVVAHLLHCAGKTLSINQEVFRFLDDASDHPAIGHLRGKACILLPDGYIRPDQAFWSDHPFGQFRKKIGAELRKYNDLFQHIGVSENPAPEDAMKVLAELTSQFGVGNHALDDGAHSVAIACWQMLESALDANAVSLEQLSALKEIKCIPNATRHLTPPSWLFFEDRAGLAAKFQGFLSTNAIPRPMGAAKAMAAAGVRTLAEVVEVFLLERSNPVENATLALRIQERRLQLARVFTAQAGFANPLDQLTRLNDIHFESVELLRINYRLQAFRQTLESLAEDCPALFRPAENKIIFVSSNGKMPWSSIARELALAICPDEEPGRIAPGIKEVLAAETADEAKLALDELGFSTLEGPAAPPSATETVTALGGETSAPTDPSPPITPPTTEPQTGGQQTTGETGTMGGTTITPQPPLGQPPTGTGGGTTTGGTTTSGGGKQTQRPRPRQPRRGKLRSYVVKDPTPSDEPPDPKVQERRHAVNLAGIAKVEAFERSLGCVPRVMPHTHPGYDIESCDANSTILRFIEVKSRSGDWGGDGVSLTTTEFLKAQEFGDLYWLYIVEKAESADFKIHCIQNPAGKVDQFFYDDSWQPVEETDHKKMRPPEDW